MKAQPREWQALQRAWTLALFRNGQLACPDQKKGAILRSPLSSSHSLLQVEILDRIVGESHRAGLVKVTGEQSTDPEAARHQCADP